MPPTGDEPRPGTHRLPGGLGQCRVQEDRARRPCLPATIDSTAFEGSCHGASGSGTTTLGRALADYWSVPHADADDYFWVPTVPPYIEKRPESARLALMRDVFVPREGWALPGSMVGWGESILVESDAVVFLTLEPRERLRRLEAREVHRRDGQEFDAAAWSDFLDWARGYDDPAFDGRSRVAHEEWLGQLDRPVLRLGSGISVIERRDAVLSWDASQG